MEVPDFTKGKIDSVKDFSEVYKSVVKELVKTYGARFTVTDDNRDLFTSQFWEPLGIDCWVTHENQAVLEKHDNPGEISEFVDYCQQKQINLDNRIWAQARILDVTEQFFKLIQPYLADAGVYSVEGPTIKFIDFHRRPIKVQDQPVKFEKAVEKTIRFEKKKTSVDPTPFCKQEAENWY